MQNKKLISVKEFANEYGIGVNKAYEFQLLNLVQKYL